MNQNAAIKQRQSIYQPAIMQQQSQQYPGQTPYQLPYKGTLAPGTKVKVGSIIVTVKQYLSEGGFAHVYIVTTSQPIPTPTLVNGAVAAFVAGSHGETTHVLKRMAVPDKEALSDVRREVQVHKMLRNQVNVVHFIEASATALQGGGYEIFILMEYCPGGGILDLMNARLRDRLKEDEVLKIFGDVCAGVAVMHHQDPPLMHRDLKVENILMSPSTAPDSNPNSRSSSSNLKATFKLCDFGSAAPVLSRTAAKSTEEVKRIEVDLNKHTTLQYRAPEMVDVYQRRVIDEKSDIWALGVLLYKLCYYTTPFEENGGGPLAILNVQYRIPPQPMYSQKLKNLIGSLLKEQSAHRPTIDQVIIDVHKILGTRPPASSVHYAQQAAAGKIFKPLPSVVGGSHAADGIEARRITAAGAQGRNGIESDLITIAPTKKEREEAEAREMQIQKESITPMRRGRPTKNAGSSAVLPSSLNSSPLAVAAKKQESNGAAVKPPRMQLTGERKSPPKSASPWKPVAAQKPASLDKASLIDGFGDSFAPSAASSVTAGSSQTRASPSFSVSKTPTSPLEALPKDSMNGLSSANHLLRPSSSSSKAGTPTLSPLRHSPALPGFSMTPSPTPSPVSQPQKAVPPSTDDSTGAEGRFPSVEELDARYGSPSPITSPLSASTTNSSAGRQAPLIPGLSSRASVGAMAGRFDKTGSIDSRSSIPAASSTAAGNVLKRWQPPTATGTVDLAPALFATPRPKRPAAAKKPSTKAAEPSSYRHSMPVFNAAPPKASSKARDWLTGEVSEDEGQEQVRPPVQETKASLAADRDERQTYKSPARFERSPAQELVTSPLEEKPAPEDLSSDDEAEGPESFESRRPKSLSVRERMSNLSKFSGSSSGQQRPSIALSLDEPPIRAQPGKIKAPSWLVEVESSQDSSLSPSKLDDPLLRLQLSSDQPESPVKPPSASRTNTAATDELEATARDAERKLEELLRGPLSPGGISPGAQAAMDDPSPPPLPARARAPAWDDDEGEEMGSLHKPNLLACQDGPVGNLVDIEASKPQAAQTGPAPNLMDEDVPSQKPRPHIVTQLRSERKYADAATSPYRQDSAESNNMPLRVEPVTPAISVPTQIAKDEPVEKVIEASKPSPPSPPAQARTSPNPSLVGQLQQSPIGDPKPAPKLTPKPIAIRVYSRNTPVIKPWEREAAAAAKASKSGVVRSVRSEEVESPQEGFRGVSSLISRWQQSVESNAPGWGRVGKETMRDV